MTRRCPRCRIKRPVADFMVRRAGRSDRTTYCTVCRDAIRADDYGWGAGLVCDCEPSIIYGCGQCIRCGRPAVASMAPHLRERLARIRPQSETQTVVRADTEVVAS